MRMQRVTVERRHDCQITRRCPLVLWAATCAIPTPRPTACALCFCPDICCQDIRHPVRPRSASLPAEAGDIAPAIDSRNAPAWHAGCNRF
jgi:hypothetical protein